MLLAVAAGSAFAVGCGGSDGPPERTTTPGEVSESVPDVLYSEDATTPDLIAEPPTYAKGSAEAGMRDVVVRFYTAVGEGKGADACKLLTEDGREALIDSVIGSGDDVASCDEAAEALADSAHDIVIGEATEDAAGSGTGVVVTQIPGIAPGHVEVAKHGDDWLIELF